MERPQISLFLVDSHILSKQSTQPVRPATTQGTPARKWSLRQVHVTERQRDGERWLTGVTRDRRKELRLWSQAHSVGFLVFLFCFIFCFVCVCDYRANCHSQSQSLQNDDQDGRLSPGRRVSDWPAWSFLKSWFWVLLDRVMPTGY